MATLALSRADYGRSGLKHAQPAMALTDRQRKHAGAGAGERQRFHTQGGVQGERFVSFIAMRGASADMYVAGLGPKHRAACHARVYLLCRHARGGVQNIRCVQELDRVRPLASSSSSAQSTAR